MLSSPQVKLISHQPGAQVHISVLSTLMGLTPAPPGKPLHICSPRRKVPERLLRCSAELYIFRAQLVAMTQFRILFTIFCKTCTYLVARWGFFFSFQANCKSISFSRLSCSRLLQPTCMAEGFVRIHHLVKKSIVFLFEIVQQTTSYPYFLIFG